MDPIENASRWNRWSARGTEIAISGILDVLDANLPNGWKRLLGDELIPFSSMVKPDSGWYSLDTTSFYVGVILSIERHKRTELRGGRVWFKGPPYLTDKPSIPTAWDQVSQFLDDGIVPAAKAVGADIRIPTLEDVFFSNLPGDVQDRLQIFSHNSRKSLPLDREESALWQEFIIAAFRARVTIDARSFTEWFVGTGWSKERAAELTQRFFENCLLLSRYIDEVSAA